MASHSKIQQVNLTLYRGFQPQPIYTWSPFVTKLEARLRFADLSYSNGAGSPLQGPRGKIPYVKISQPDSSIAPTTIGDSTLITSHLVSEGVISDLNAGLDPVQKAHDLALRSLLEDKLYFYQSYERWHDNYYTMRPHVLQALSYPMQLIVGILAYRSFTATCQGQGTGKFSPEEMAGFKKEVWQSVEALLGESRRKMSRKDGTFWVLGGPTPSEADTAVFGFIVSVLCCAA